LPEVKMKADKKMKDDWDGPELTYFSNHFIRK